MIETGRPIPEVAEELGVHSGTLHSTVLRRPVEVAEYVSRRFRWACQRLGVTQSMGRGGSCFDNAVSEAFNSVLKVEYVHRHTFATRTEARLRIATWITGFYNTHRLHSVCSYRSPIDYEHDHRANSALELAA
ncbi:integrase core domain-containing protein [Streptomyces phaeochromogenes]|uniref:integrase core domain-containing protein n=1 Tax=Streptomyces phaeochromogenes TaxID=1923 RepID=UPI0033ED8CD8